MWHAVCFFIAIILLLLGIWLYSTSVNGVDPVAASQRRTWAFVALIVGFFLLFVAAACHDQLKSFRY